MTKLILSLFIVVLFFSCKKSENTSYTYQLSRLKSEYINTRWSLIYDLHDECSEFKGTVNQLTTTVQTSFLNLSREKWLSVYEKYLLLQPYTFSNSTYNSDLVALKNRLDFYSINESYVDSTFANPSNGIIVNPATFPDIIPSTISNWHQLNTPMNATLGFHVIEFLLFGTDINMDGANYRPISDFSSITSYGLRRGYFLGNSTQVMLSDIASLKNNKSIDSAIKKLSNQEFVNLIFDQLISEIDFVMEKGIKTPYDSQNPQDEIAKSSNRTTEVLINMIKSVEFFLDAHSSTNGADEYALLEFINELRPDLAIQISDNLENSRVTLQNLNGNFESLITNPTARVQLLKSYNFLSAVKRDLLTFKSGLFN